MRKDFAMCCSLLPMLVLLTGCDTVYQPLGWDGGYEDKPLGQARHWIKYQGNATTRHTWVTQSWHQRAAQLCINGYEVTEIERSVADPTKPNILKQPFKRENPVTEGQVQCTKP